MKVRDAIAQLGVDVDHVAGELCIVQITKAGARHYTLPDVADREITRDLYLATGTFAPGSITEYAGRTAENLTSILWLIADCDLKDYLGVPATELRSWSDGDLMTAARALAQDVRELYELMGVPVHRVDYTGYGIAVYTCLNGHTSAEIPELRDLNRALVETINQRWGSTLADPGVHDAGTRIMRLVPGPNTKGPTPRQAQSIYRADGHVSVNDLRKTLQTRTRSSVGRVIPRSGSLLPASVLHDLIDAIGSHWLEGKRHGLALAIAGILAKAGVPEEQAVALVEHIALVTGDAEIEDRRKAVATSYARARNGLETRGLFGLRDWLPNETVEWIDRTLDEVRPRVADMTFTAADGPSQGEGVADDNNQEFVIAPIPATAGEGLIGEYIELMKPTTEASEGYHLGVGLTVVGAMIGRRIFVNYGSPLYANLFTLLVGTSGKSRKDTAIKRGTRMLTSRVSEKTKQRQSNVQIVMDVTSAEGLISSLSEHTNILLYLTEFSRLMANAKRKGTTTIAPVLMEAFDTPTKISNLSKLNPVTADYPYLSILSATQPRILEGLMSEEDVHSGFINRWLIVPGESESPLPWPTTVDNEIVLLLFEKIHTAIHDAYPESFAIDLDADALPFWKSWYVDEWQRKQTEDESAMRVRHPVMVIKLALIYTVLNGDLLITRDVLERAVAIVDWMWSHVSRLLPGWGGTLAGRIEAKITQELTDRGPTKKRVLTQYCRSRTWSTQDFNAAVEAMYKAGLIHIDANGTVGFRND
jgi:hypothetical protein